MKLLHLAKIHKRTVPVRGSHRRTVVTFAAGEHGKREAGRYHFWTAHGRDRYGAWTIVCRNRERLAYGERFERIRREQRSAASRADRAAYKRAWALVRNAEFIQPADLRAVARWAASHKSDWQHVIRIECDGRTYRRLPRSLS